MKPRLFKTLLCPVLTMSLLFPHPAAADEVITEDISLNPEVITVTEPEGASPDELFADYVDSILYGESSDGRKRAVSNKLRGLDLTVYNLLKERIEKVAAGELDSTEFLLSSEELGLEGMTWTAEQIGTDAIVVYDETQGKNVISKDALNALNEYLDVHYSLIFKTLLAEMPYSLYWFDKTTGWSYYNFGASYDGTEWFLTADSGLRFRFAVSSEYSSEGSQYTVDTSVGQAVTAARSTAAGIVTNYTSLSDYEKLKGYKDSICSLVSYNRPAANGGAPYGNPWQLIWVFDNDPESNVVCEGYAKAFKYLCDLSSFTGEIDCLLATGEMDGGTGAGGHMWNIVNMDDGKNYLVDVTNCDAGTVGAPDKLFLVGNADGSAASGYTFALSKNISFTYDSDTLALFSDDELTLAVSDYDPNAFHVHSWDAGVITKEATCIEAGEITFTCSCGEIRTEELPIDSAHHTGRTEIRNASEATYDSEGYTGDTYCADCEALLETGEIIPVLETDAAIDISTATIVSIPDQTYTGEALTPYPVVMLNDTILIPATDYDTEWKNNVNAGTAAVIIKGKNNYTGTVQADFTIAPKNITPVITLSPAAYTYDGKVKSPAVTVKDGSVKLKPESYTVTLPSGCKNAGTYSITVELTGNYTGSGTATFKINKAAQTITAKASASSVAVGKATTISVSGTKESPKLTYKSSDTGIAAVSTAGKITAKKVGTVKITVTAAATTNYAGKSVPVTVKVVPAATTSVSTANLAKGIKVTWKKVTGATGYYLYRNNKLLKKISNGNTVTFTDTAATSNGGKYIYKVTAFAATGTSTLSKSVTTYQVARPAISSLTSPKTKQLLVKWGKNAKATGYQIQYSTSSTFASGNKSVTVKGAATVSRTITSLLAKKRYYVRIRTYMTVSGKNYYSAWSAAKNVVTK